MLFDGVREGRQLHFFFEPQQPPFAFLRVGPGGFDGSTAALFWPLRCLSILFIWKTTLNAVWNTLFRPFFSLAEQITKPWKAYFLAAASISALETVSRSLTSSPYLSSSSRRSSLVPTRMQGHARAVVLTSDIHFLQAYSREFGCMRLKQMMKQSVFA